MRGMLMGCFISRSVAEGKQIKGEPSLTTEVYTRGNLISYLHAGSTGIWRPRKHRAM